MPLLARVFVGAALLLGWLFFELSLRKDAGLRPSCFQELRRYLDRRVAPRPEWIPFLFVVVALLCFSVWEFLLGHMFGRAADHWSWLLSLLVWGVALYQRKRAFVMGHPRLSLMHVLLLMLSWVLLFKSVLGLLMLLWVAARGSFLKTTKG